MQKSNGPDKVTTAIEALDRAIDNVTTATVEKLDSIINRVTALKESIKQKNLGQKAGHAELLKMIHEAEKEAERLNHQADDIEATITGEPKPTKTLRLPGVEAKKEDL